MSTQQIISICVFLILYTGLLFGGWAWMLNTQTKQIDTKIEPIKELLTNHITDTNKKNDDNSKKIDKLGDRFDRLSDRFDRLYELLLQEKNPK